MGSGMSKVQGDSGVVASSSSSSAPMDAFPGHQDSLNPTLCISPFPQPFGIPRELRKQTGIYTRREELRVCRCQKSDSWP